MVNVFKLLMAVLLVSFGATALGQCLPMNGPGPPRLWDGQRGCYVAQGTPAVGQPYYVGQQQVYQQQVYQQQLPPGAIRVQPGVMPQGYCPWGGRFENVIGGGVIGALIGALAGDNHRAAGQGAALGALAGVAIPCQQQVQQVAYQQPVYGNGEIGGSPQYQNTGRAVSRTRFTCTIPGMPVVSVDREEDCGIIARRIAGEGNQRQSLPPQGGNRAPSLPTYGKVPVSINGNTCAIGNDQKDIIVDFHDASRNPKGIVVSSGQECAAEKQAFAAANGLRTR